MKRYDNKNGFTLAEVLAVIGIMAVIAAFAMIAISNYMRLMAKIEYDSYAKELFIAAQNNLSMAESQGYLGRTEFGIDEEKQFEGRADSAGVYYFLSGVTSPDNENTVFNLMLPFGSIDETIRTGGRYLVRYHRDSGQVPDVFYWSESGRFPYSFNPDDYADFLTISKAKLTSETAMDDVLRRFKDSKAVIGYYGGVEAQNLTKADVPLTAPIIVVENGDKLTVRITNPNSANTNARLRLLVTGETSNAVNYIDINMTEVHDMIVYDEDSGTYTVTLDDVNNSGENGEDMRFCSIFTAISIPLSSQATGA